MAVTEAAVMQVPTGSTQQAFGTGRESNTGQSLRKLEEKTAMIFEPESIICEYVPDLMS